MDDITTESTDEDSDDNSGEPLTVSKTAFIVTDQIYRQEK